MSDDPILDEIVRRIRQAVDPDQIILFGSRARGDARPDSDYDILIIAPSDQPRWRRSLPARLALAGIGVPRDIVWWTPQEVAEWSRTVGHFLATALREGQVLYERAA